MARCPKCGNDVQNQSLICPDCGYQIPSRTSFALCPKCGHSVSDNARFCSECGHALSDSATSSQKRLFKFSHIWLLILCTVIVICNFWYKSSEQANRRAQEIEYARIFGDYGSSSYSGSSYTKNNSSTLFRNLKISNFSSKLGKYKGELLCEVTNNNSVTVFGYFYVNYYDSQGKLLCSQIVSLPDVAPGETVTCSAFLTKEEYPSGYDYVKFTQSTIVES